MTTTIEPNPATTQGPRRLDPREPEVRLVKLLDRDSLEELHPTDTSGVWAVRGRIDGARVVAYCTDGTRMGGAMGREGCRHIVDAIDTAVRERVPVIGLWHSGGARLAEGVASLDGVGHVFAAMVRASGRVPQISVVLGAAAGGAAYGPALTDIVIMSPEGRVFVTGPDVVKSVTGEQVDMEALGGPAAHGRKSGVVHIVADSEDDAYVRARKVTSLFSRPGIAGIAGLRDDPELAHVLPPEKQRAYNVKPLIDRILDEPMEELQAKWAPNISIGLGRLAGRSVGVIANNPLRLGGCLDSTSAEKASRFVRMCDSFGIPLLVIVDVPGYLPGVGQEWDGVVRRGAKLLHAFAEAVVPQGDAGDPQGIRRGLHRHELQGARGDRGVRLARRGDRRDGGQGRRRHPAPAQAGGRAGRRAGRPARATGGRAREGRRRRRPGGGDRRGRRGDHPGGDPAAGGRSAGLGPGRPRLTRQHPAVTLRGSTAVTFLAAQHAGTAGLRH